MTLRLNSVATRYTMAILAHVALVLGWYLFVRIGEVPRFVMPSPGDTLASLMEPNDDWWFNIRPSNTESLLRLNAEGRDPATMERVRDDALKLIRSHA